MIKKGNPKKKAKNRKGVISVDSKKYAEIIHAGNRLFERYGMAYTTEIRLIFLEKIKTNQSIPIKKQTNRLTIHQIIFESNIINLVYDKARKEIVTFLPLEC